MYDEATHIFPHQLETERLILRPPRPGDGRLINDAIHESFSELHRWMPWARAMPSIEESESFARDAWARYRARDDYPIILIDRKSGALIGASGLHPRDWSVPKFEIGYWARTSWAGRGYITEAVHALVDFAFEGLHAQRLIIRCDAENRRSAAVAERAGFHLEARLHHDARDNQGDLCDMLLYARLPSSGS